MPRSPINYSLSIPPFHAKTPGGWINKVLQDQTMKDTEETLRILPITMFAWKQKKVILMAGVPTSKWDLATWPRSPPLYWSSGRISHSCQQIYRAGHLQVTGICCANKMPSAKERNGQYSKQQQPAVMEEMEGDTLKGWVQFRKLTDTKHSRKKKNQ